MAFGTQRDRSLSAAGDTGPSQSCLFHISDRIAGARFLTDAGAEVTVAPASSADLTRCTYTPSLQALTGTSKKPMVNDLSCSISVYGVVSSSYSELNSCVMQSLEQAFLGISICWCTWYTNGYAMTPQCCLFHEFLLRLQQSAPLSASHS